ncbi:TonB-dependent receptor [Stakelama saccharophila]|uniref:TonB-dependent receptor n=1 Tax=Stakelama saccharophila TaxID=3075605 RepID=A0ABZ0BAQ0_9SPHN|nr:TonB-dependent receptor [Stakelama sp. W311]WNO53756.1 TonB-dependent receptor [Stakelama sp. W311]
MTYLAYTSSLLALVVAAQSATAQAKQRQSDQDRPPAASPAPVEAISPAASASRTATSVDEIVVTATRRSERLQDVPLSITAFSQEELTQKGIVSYEGIARETPGVVLDTRSDNNVSITTRGISTNGYQAGLQSTTTVYLDELPLTTIGNSVTLDPNLYDVERVEFLRGPQGTLFGSGSLSGALRILTKSPELDHFDMSALADIGLTPDGGGVRQRYNAMVNVPLVEDTLGVRAVGFFRHEEGYVDNVGLGIKNSNTLKDWGGRVIALWKPSDRLGVRLMALYEDSFPEDASLVTPSLGDRKRYSTIPDHYTSKTQLYNGTLDYDFDFAHLTSSTSYGYQDGLFEVDLSGTFALALPFYLFDHGTWKTFVQETRLVSDPGGTFDWTVGGYYLRRDQFLEGRQTSTPEYLAAHGITGLPADATFNQFGSDTSSYELAGFGELTYHLSDTLSVTGGLRYGKYGATVDTHAGFNSLYFAYALGGISGPLALTPNAASTTEYPSAEKASWKASLTYKPSPDLTAYVTVSTGYRTPVYNARAGSVSTVDPNDLVIPEGAGSDNLTNYEIGLKGRFFDGLLTANLAAYYIDWRNIQVQANRQSDSIQFATNIGGAVSKGLEAEIVLAPARGLSLGLNGSLNDAQVTDLTESEAAISGAVDGARLASPRLQGSFYGTYSYDLPGGATGFSSFQVQHVGSFPNGFPNTPGDPTTPNPLIDDSDAYTNINLQTGVRIGRMRTTFYVENVTNSRAVTYVHPEAFTYSRYSILRPRTFGVRVGFDL